MKDQLVSMIQQFISDCYLTPELMPSAYFIELKNGNIRPYLQLCENTEEVSDFLNHMKSIVSLYNPNRFATAVRSSFLIDDTGENLFSDFDERKVIVCAYGDEKHAENFLYIADSNNKLNLVKMENVKSGLQQVFKEGVSHRRSFPSFEVPREVTEVLELQLCKKNGFDFETSYPVHE